MDRIFFERNLSNLLVQRNFLVGISTLLAIGLILTAAFLFFKTERIIVVPSVIEKEFWIDSHSVSASYLEQFGVFLGGLLLNKSAHSADIQRTVLCRHTEPNYLAVLKQRLVEEAVLKQRLVEEEDTLKKQNASYVFYLHNVFVNPELLTVTLLGDRQFFIAGKQTASENCGYTLQFTYQGARLLLNGISQEKERTLLGVHS
jgi:conjugal transfer pilus assembly protein TraE